MDSSNMNGHRERLRRQFLSAGLDSFADHQILELILTYAISRQDVKPQAKLLLKRFGSIQNVLRASLEDLAEVDGIGEKSAILIKLFNDVPSAVGKRKNTGVKRLSSKCVSIDYVSNLLSDLNEEQIIMITLKSSNEIIMVHTVSTGVSARTELDKGKLLKAAVRDNPAGVIIAHNHPLGSSAPSASDIDFTISLRSLLETLGIHLIDHIIIGEDEPYSMRSDSAYHNFFI